MPLPVAAAHPVKPYEAKPGGGGMGLGKPLVATGGILGAIFLFPTILAHGCKAGATVLGLPEGSCPIISIGSCCCSAIAVTLAGVGLVTRSM